MGVIASNKSRAMEYLEKRAQHTVPTPKAKPAPEPKRLEDPPKKKPSKKKSRLNWKKISFWVAIIIVIYFGYQWLLAQFIKLLQLHPQVWSTYQFISNEIAEKSLLGLLFLTSFGALFFLPNPFEAAFSYYITQTQYYGVQLIVIALIGFLAGMAANYFIGWLIGPKVLRWCMRKKYEKLHTKVQQSGGWLILLGNVIPFFPIGPFTLIMGALRYGAVKLLLFTAVGAAIKLLLFWISLHYFQSTIAPWLASQTTILDIFT